MTSTGTEVGKTIVSGLLSRAMDSPAAYFKPVASGCRDGNWGYRSPDEEYMLERVGLPEEHVEAGFRYRAPLSPDKAAEKEGERLRLASIVKRCRTFLQRYPRVVVEGIGGVAVPFNFNQDVADLARELDLPTVLVVSSRLGTISHTRTAVSYLEQNRVSTDGILLTPRDGEPIEKTNRDHLREFYPDRPVELLPRVDGTESISEASRIMDEFLPELRGTP